MTIKEEMKDKVDNSLTANLQVTHQESEGESAGTWSIQMQQGQEGPAQKETLRSFNILPLLPLSTLL